MGNQGDIKLKTGKYSKYVEKIDKSADAILTDKEPKEAPEACKQNCVIPDYEFADQSMFNTLTKFQSTMDVVTRLMRNVLNYHKGIDQEASGG
ncbi:hypothetical protein [Butyrivibrio proteoclasticus]|uniref:hypothetical protein n=1 Tax=Butyrivibrio proteoclasticus TaxID=43305 RepID=UPI00047D8B86|nr:hypothetical protein [Butyrivibrio proteoclasticus]